MNLDTGKVISVTGHYPEGTRKIINLCYAHDMLFISDKNKVYYRLIETTGQCQKIFWANFSTLILDLDSSKAFLIIVMKQVFKMQCEGSLSLEVTHYLFLYFIYIYFLF